jgi:uncharacterized protein (TIGR00725 family)
VPLGDVLVIGPNEATPAQEATAEQVGALLGRLGVAMICGGRQGVMQGAAKGAASTGGIAIGLLPDSDPNLANPFITVAIASNLGEARNAIIAQASHCLIAIGDSHGTLSEVALGLRLGKTVFGLAGAATLAEVRQMRDVVGHRAGDAQGMACRGSRAGPGNAEIRFPSLAGSKPQMDRGWFPETGNGDPSGEPDRRALPLEDAHEDENRVAPGSRCGGGLGGSPRSDTRTKLLEGNRTMPRQFSAAKLIRQAKMARGLFELDIANGGCLEFHAKLIFDAFGVYFVIDPLQGGALRIRLSQTAPAHNEQSLAKDAREFHRAAAHIKEASDGVQAFVGILTAVLSGDYRSILIDEPEAFLHPPLARKLGYQLATTVAKRSGSLMASTHSPDFLIGCLQGSSQVRVVRLEYANGKSKGQVVDSNALKKFFKAPLIRSANVISALFHDGVVVTESDNDRAFYSEIYYRLAEKQAGYPSLLFVNAQNKQTIRDIIEPLRAFGVPAAAIVDIDILKDGGSTWTGWLKAANLPAPMTGSLGVLRGDLYKRFLDAKVDMKADGGVNALKGGDRDAVSELFDTLDQFGVFATRNGEIESWLRHLNVPGKKADWTVAMLEKLGDDSNKPDYVQPTTDDVWAFIERVVAWIRNSDRKGMVA